MVDSSLQQMKRAEILLNAAIQFSEKGYAGTNINEVAVQSGLGKGTIYLYFKNKKELYLSTLQNIVDTFNESTDQLMSAPLSAFEKLTHAIELFFSMEQQALPYLKLWARHQFQSNPVFPEEVSDLFTGLRQPLCEIIEQGNESGEFYTEHPKVIGYFLLSAIVTLMPSLQATNTLQMENEQRTEVIKGIAKKLLTK